MSIKKITAAVLAVVMCMGCLSACGKKTDEDKSSSNSEKSSAGTADTKQEVNMEIRDISSWELVQEMSVGWNLGNTFDATGDLGLGNETAWQPNTTTEDMIKLLHDTGFDVFRLPVTWDSHMDENYNVDPEWMARIHEVVDWGINNGMFVILNTHHEEWYFPTEEDKAQDIEQLTALWKQIAEEFKGYDEHLIFEGLNEPRKRGTNVEWNGGDNEGQLVVADYAKAFYETVRATGGNNEKRHLMLTGYAASSSRNALEQVWLPENDDKVIVSVHAYLPYSMALDINGTDKFDENNTEIDSLFYNLKDLFLSKNIPVIIGEYGTVNKDNLEDRIACAKKYIGYGAENHVPMIWWDNNAFFGNGENFGLMGREAPAEWRTPELVDAIIEQGKKYKS
ncbi:MAG: glycoside hydrolase family 5 protein [Ruminococcus sp.]|nr:glycoside hydrolase family 5 protein [Ruminococcus sp.]